MATSQWDFSGELFPREAIRHVLTVSDLTGQIRRILEKQIGRVWVSGEITNLRLQSSGHVYFTLKDSGAQLSCVLFRGDCIAQRDYLQDGRKVLLQGEITVYEPRGQYQMQVVEIEMQGVGALQIAFEKLKQKLNSEGLFAVERKRSLPRFPQRIGLITSPTGAAIRDVLHVIQRRHPALQIVFVPCRVQGTAAAQEIASALRSINAWNASASEKLDLILLTRGGGSLEDLWAFNEEAVARAIHDSSLPVVSAIGHEIDFTISDFVADMRAATPSAAAEIITEGVFGSGKFIAEISEWMDSRVQQLLQRKQDRFTDFSRRLGRAHPRREILQKLQYLDDLQTSLSRCVAHDLGKQRRHAEMLRQRLSRLRPKTILQQRREVLTLASERLSEQVQHRLQEFQNRATQLQTRLRLLSPEQVLARGYSITTAVETGEVIRDAAKVIPGQKIRTRLAKGTVHSEVIKN